MNLSINNNRGFAVWTFISVFHIFSIANFALRCNCGMIQLCVKNVDHY
jgi:hypothetical protein